MSSRSTPQAPTLRCRGLWLTCAILVSLVAACSPTSSTTTLDASNRAFEGLDSEVVGEVLTNPVALKKLQEEPVETKESSAQGMVRNFIWCRALYGAYLEWQNTGVRPAAPALARPANPLDPSDADWKQTYPEWSEVFRSGDIDTLRADLVDDSYCGVWVPAKPGDVSGPTIADAVASGA